MKLKALVTGLVLAAALPNLAIADEKKRLDLVQTHLLIVVSVLHCFQITKCLR